MTLRGEEATDEHLDMIEAAVAKFEDLGFVNDRGFAETKTRSLRRKGNSTRMVEAKLAAKGVERDTIDAVVSEDETTDMEAAAAYARRRRLGPWRTREREERRDRDVAAMMRAGFGFSIAAAIIDKGDDPASEAGVPADPARE